MRLRPPIADHREVGPSTRRLVFHSPELAACAKPGQFVHVLCGSLYDPLLRRPFSIHDADADSGLISLLYEVRGRGTALLAEKLPGEILDVLGPLGNGFVLPESGDQPVLLVGGGMGVAPLKFLSRAIIGSIGADCLSFNFGARTAEMHVCLEDFRCACPDAESRLSIATDDGSLGEHGFVTDLLAKRVNGLSEPKSALVYACGPTPMLRAVARIAKEHDLACQVSLEAKMACGVGACMGCVIKVRSGDDFRYVRVCKEGTVFDAHEVIWDE